MTSGGKIPQQQSKSRALPILVVVQLVVAVITIAVTVIVSFQIRPLIERKNQLEREVKTLEETIDKQKFEISIHEDDIKNLDERKDNLQRLLEDLEARLLQATNFERSSKDIDLLDLKAIESLYPKESLILQEIFSLRDQEVKWQLGGRSPEEGFDSSNFVVYLLRKLNLRGGEIQPGESLQETNILLWQNLRAISEPRVGDLVFYPSGYVLFYFKDRNNQPFVIGMTPLGITSLEPNFADILSYRSTK